MSGQIFISYRREQSGWWAGRLYDRLCRDFDRSQIFMDIDTIALGADFVDSIETTVAKCDLLIALIGNNWLTSKDDQGERRLDNPEDFVRIEIATALKRGIRVIPVLVDGALMPQSGELPDDLKPLARRQALELNHDRFDIDFKRLASTIRRFLEITAEEQLEREREESNPLVMAARFFSEALGGEQARIRRDVLRFALPDSDGYPRGMQAIGIAAIWDQQRSTTLLLTLKNLKRTEGYGISRLYLLHSQERPEPKILQEWRRELEWEVVPVPSQLVTRALARHESERILKELEEPYVTRTDPYLESKPITDPTWFFGRQEQLNRLTSILAQGQHGGIFGLRKIGKTSLINQIQRRFADTPTALVDCQAFGASATEYLREISIQLRDDLSGLGVRGIPPLLGESNDTDALRKHLLDLAQTWRASGREEPFLVIMDEIDKLFPYEGLTAEEPVAPLFAWLRDRLPSFGSGANSTSLVLEEYVRLFRVLRGLAQTRNCIVLLVVAYRPDVNRRNLITAKSGENPMFRSYHEEYVGCLSADESESLVREIGQWRHIDWELGAASCVYKYCGGHPLVTRIFASKASERGTRKLVTVVRTEETALEIALTFRKNDIGNYYREGIWKLLQEKERHLLKKVTQNEDYGVVESGLDATTQEALTNLENLGLVRVNKGRVEVVAELFKRWLDRMF